MMVRIDEEEGISENHGDSRFPPLPRISRVPTRTRSLLRGGLGWAGNAYMGVEPIPAVRDWPPVSIGHNVMCDGVKQGCDVTELDEAARRRCRHRPCIAVTEHTVQLSAWMYCLGRVRKVPSVVDPETLGAVAPVLPDSPTHIGQAGICLPIKLVCLSRLRHFGFPEGAPVSLSSPRLVP